MNSDATDGSAEDAELIEDRARAIAREEGRFEVHELDRETARQELREPPTGDDALSESIAEDDRPDAGVAPGSSGGRVERTPLENEDSASEEWIREGVEHADSNTRTHSGSNREL